MDNKLLKKVSITPMRLHDIVMVRRIDQKNATQWPLRYYVKILGSPHFYSNLAWIKDTYVGSITYRLVPPVMHIDKILVDKSYQQWGMGGKLLEKSIFEAQKKGAQRACLSVSILNKNAINFYTKHGFIVDSVKSNYYSTGDDGLNMVRIFKG